MAEKIRIDKFREECEKALSEYRNLAFKSLKKAVDSTARQTVKEIREKAPKRTGKYSEGWTSTKDIDSSDRYSRIVRNRRRYSLAHLLQHGHVLKGYIAKRTTKTHVPAFPHIPSDEDTEKLFESNLEKEINK